MSPVELRLKELIVEWDSLSAVPLQRRGSVACVPTTDQADSDVSSDDGGKRPADTHTDHTDRHTGHTDRSTDHTERHTGHTDQEDRYTDNTGTHTGYTGTHPGHRRPQ